MPDYLYVDRPDDISPNLTGHTRLGVDTEFMREKTYFAQLCLIQLATPDDIYCVDPLVAHGQAEFWKQLLDCSWVLHSGRQDIEVVLQLAGSMPRELFDTQIAAGLLGMPAQMGYAGLVKELFDVEAFNRLGEGVREKIEASPEYQEMMQGTSGGGDTTSDDDDDVPF